MSITCRNPFWPNVLFVSSSRKTKSLIRTGESPNHLIRELGKITDIFASLKHVSVFVYDGQK